MKTSTFTAALIALLAISATAIAQDSETRRLSNLLVGKWIVDEAACRKLSLNQGYSAAGLHMHSLEFTADGEKLWTARIRPDCVKSFLSDSKRNTTYRTGADGNVHGTLKMRWEPIEVIDAKRQIMTYKSISYVRREQVRQAGFCRDGRLVEGNVIFERAD